MPVRIKIPVACDLSLSVSLCFSLFLRGRPRLCFPYKCAGQSTRGPRDKPRATTTIAYEHKERAIEKQYRSIVSPVQ